MNTFSHTIFYVQDVAKTMAFYEKAFGIKQAFIDPTGQYGQMDTGAAVLGFASLELAKRNLPKEFRPFSPKELPGCEISFIAKDVHRSFTHAVKAGAELIASPEEKPWGQTVGYVCDFNGILVEIASEMACCSESEEEDPCKCC